MPPTLGIMSIQEGVSAPAGGTAPGNYGGGPSEEAEDPPGHLVEGRRPGDPFITVDKRGHWRPPVADL